MTSTTTTSTLEYRRLTEDLGFTHAEAMKTIENRRQQDRRVREALLDPDPSPGSFPGFWKRPGGVEETITAGSHFG